jgi:hypothetical protein
MAEIAEIHLKINAVEFALGSFADYEIEGERRNFLRQNFTEIPGLKTYFSFSTDKLQDALKQLQDEKNLLLDALKQLQEKENLLLAQQQGWISF